MAGSSDWARLVDEIAGADEDNHPDALLDLLASFQPTVPAGVLERDRARFQDRKFEPMLSREDAFHAKPAKAHQTDAFVASSRRDDTDFLEALEKVLASKAKPEAPLVPDFDPIILVPEVPTALVQKCNVKRFLQEGVFKSVEQLRAEGDPLAQSVIAARGQNISVEPAMWAGLPNAKVAFRSFRVVDDPKTVENWDHVCACFVTGHAWQFDNFFPPEVAERTSATLSKAEMAKQWEEKVKESNRKKDPANLFADVRGYYAFFEEQKLPTIIKEWRVVPLQLTQKATKQHTALRVAAMFWEDLYGFLDSHPFFRRYTVAPIKA